MNDFDAWFNRKFLETLEDFDKWWTKYGGTLVVDGKTMVTKPYVSDLLKFLSAKAERPQITTTECQANHEPNSELAQIPNPHNKRRINHE
jgi:hypothetical protein